MYGETKYEAYEKKVAQERKTLIDLESHVKQASEHLKEALNMVDVLRGDMATWELAHHMYSGLESCDKALDMIFAKESAAEKGPDARYVDYYELGGKY